MTKVIIASEGVDQPLKEYHLSQAEITMVGCSIPPMFLGHTTPLDIHFDGDAESRKITVNETIAANIGTTFAAPNGPSLTAGVAVGKGRSAETMACRWEVTFHDIDERDHAHLRDEAHTSLDGGVWRYTPNPEFRKISRATFMDDRSPLGVFRTSEVVPAKLEMKLISFWELPSAETAHLWVPAFMTHRRRPIPAFANFIFGISTIIDLKNDPTNKGPRMKVILDDKFEAPLSEDPLRTVKHCLQGGLEVPMVSAIMGRATLSKAEYRGQGKTLF
jgi:hypothetical protein